MPKKILFESAVHQFASAGSRLRAQLESSAPHDAHRLAAWLKELRIDHPAAGLMRIAWTRPTPGEHQLEFKPARFYLRGDTAVHADRQRASGFGGSADPVMTENSAFFDAALRAVLADARLLERPAAPDVPASPPSPVRGRVSAEQVFHDGWARHEDISRIDVRKRNEACTAPEMRHIRRVLGDLRGKTLLDVGCGLGEASVYFALLGADVTATDVSAGMCDATQRLAVAHGVRLETHVSAAEDLQLGERQFDIIYTGNTLHHVDIAQTMERLRRHLRAGGTFVSWDPVAYNPIINVYRRVAMQVRTIDEHPLRLRDIEAIRGCFEQVEIRWFWFTTLLVFLWMVFIQRLNPNRVRLWKRVIDDADRLAWLYRPLERIDLVLLQWIPFLRPLCWNVVIVGRQPQTSSPSRRE